MISCFFTVNKDLIQASTLSFKQGTKNILKSLISSPNYIKLLLPLGICRHEVHKESQRANKIPKIVSLSICLSFQINSIPSPNTKEKLSQSLAINTNTNDIEKVPVEYYRYVGCLNTSLCITDPPDSRISSLAEIPALSKRLGFSLDLFSPFLLGGQIRKFV